MREYVDNSVLEKIVGIVWEKYPEGNLKDRLDFYDRIAETFAAMAKVLRTENKESKNEEPSTQETPEDGKSEV